MSQQNAAVSWSRDGAVLSKVPLPNITANLTRKLNAVWGTSATNVYAVGDNGTILHYLP